MNASQKRAIADHRRRLTERGFARYEVRGLARDKELVREFAKRLADDGADAARLREVVQTAPQPIAGRGGFLAAILRSPLVGSGIRLEREVVPGRDVDF